MKLDKANLSCPELDGKFLPGFRDFMRVKLNNDVNTILKNPDYLKTYGTIAYRDEIIKNKPFDF